MFQFKAIQSMWCIYFISIGSAFLHSDGCSGTVHQSIISERGEVFRERIYIDSRWSWSGKALVLDKNNELALARCTGQKNGTLGLYNITCKSTASEKYNLETTDSCNGGCYLDVIIRPIQYVDEGVYYIHRENSSCKYFALRLTLRKTHPQCVSFYIRREESLEMKCTWLWRHGDIEARLLAHNRTLYSHSNSGMLNSNFTVTKITMRSSLDDTFSANNIPTKCVVTKFGFEDTCNFIVFLQPKEIYLKPDEFESTNISYMCCSANDNVNGIWVVINGKRLHINSTGSIAGTIKENEIILVCGKESRSGLLLHGIGKLHVTSPVSLNFLISPSSSSEDLQCKYQHNIIVTASAIRTKSPCGHISELGNETSKYSEVDIIKSYSTGIPDAVWVSGTGDIVTSSDFQFHEQPNNTILSTITFRFV